MKYFIGLMLGSFLAFDTVNGQTIFTSTLNATGESKRLSPSGSRFSNYTFEWSVGESSIITTNQFLNIQLTHGLLQGFLLNVPIVPATGIWYPDEIKIYPNPVLSDFSVELLSDIKGVVNFNLYDSKGVVAFNKTINYQGIGVTERFDISYLPSGNYLLRIVIRDFTDNGGKIIKQGGYKIIKIR